MFGKTVRVNRSGEIGKVKAVCDNAEVLVNGNWHHVLAVVEIPEIEIAEEKIEVPEH